MGVVVAGRASFIGSHVGDDAVYGASTSLRCIAEASPGTPAPPEPAR